MDDDLGRALSGSKLRLRQKSAYFSVLANYLRPLQVPDDHQVQTAATDSKYLFIQKKFWLGLSQPKRDFVLVHEVLHAALGHCWRIGGRHPIRWNFAADYVVNLIAKKAGFEVPGDCLIDEKYDGMSTEEVYVLLEGELDWASVGWGSVLIPGDVLRAPSEGGELGKVEKRQWAGAKAAAAAADKMYGDSSAGDWIRVAVEDSTTNWQEIIWRELGSGRSEFKEWERALVYSETYVESIEQEDKPMRCAICVDTSGSTLGILGRFCGEIARIASMYDNLEVLLYWADAELIGPVPIDEYDKPRGGGGTSFVPFFDEVKKKGYERAVYLTDLDGLFPAEQPEGCRVIWAVPAGGNTSAPWGEVVRIFPE